MSKKDLSTEQRIEQLQGKEALLKTWEQLPATKLIDNREYVRELRSRTRQVRNYILNRADRQAEI